jgi:hypothetical protein
MGLPQGVSECIDIKIFLSHIYTVSLLVYQH